MRMLHLFRLFAILLLLVPTLAEPPGPGVVEEEHFKFQFSSPQWRSTGDESELYTYALGEETPRMVFAVALAARPEKFDQQSEAERQDIARRAVENSSNLMVLSVKEGKLAGWPGTLMYLQDPGGLEQGFSFLLTTDRRSYLLTALTSAQESELLKQEFSQIIGTFQPLD